MELGRLKGKVEERGWNPSLSPFTLTFTRTTQYSPPLAFTPHLSPSPLTTSPLTTYHLTTHHSPLNVHSHPGGGARMELA